MPGPELLVRASRGGVVESTHVGSVVVVERDRTIFVRGDSGRVAFYRSTSKPLQALPLVTSGAADAFGLGDDELALAAGSHSGTREHVETARSLLAKAGVAESALGCGGHWSTDAEALAWQRSVSNTPLAVFSNCSGKHAGMLAVARHLGAPLEGYLSPTHPVQQRILASLARFAGLAPRDVRVAVDGCGAPTFGVPLLAMARSLANLGDPRGLPGDEVAAARRVGEAMRTRPEMVAGRQRFDTDLMRAAGGRVLAKAGAEGVHGVAVPARGIGMAVKVEDGSDRGYRILVVEVLKRLGVLDGPAAATVLERHAAPVLRNWAGTAVGTLEPVLGDGGDTLRP